MVLSKVDNNWHKHWECLVLVGLQDIEEIIILEEAHRSISNLQMNTTNTSDDSLEESGNQVLYLINFTYFQDFLKLSQEQCFFDTVGEWPILQQTFEEWYSKSSIFCQEQHWASQELFIKLWTRLNFMKRNNDVLEENDMLIPEWYSESTDDTCKDVQKLSCTIKFVSFMN